MTDREQKQIRAARRVALVNHCRLAGETVNPNFRRILPIGVSVILTVNSGYE